MKKFRNTRIQAISFFFSIGMIILSSGCVTNDTVPDSFARTLNVRKTVESIDDKTKKIELTGSGLMNYAGCIEAFSIKADKVWKDAPYSYEFDAEEIERVIKPAVENTGYGFNQAMQTSIAQDLGAYAGLYVLLLELGEVIDSQTWTTKEWQIRGITKKEPKIFLNKNTPVNVIIPDDLIFKNKSFEGSGVRLAKVSADALANYFDKVKSYSSSQESGINVHINVIRWQDRHPMSGMKDIITAEYAFAKGLEKEPFGQFLVIAKEPFFTKESLTLLIPKNPPPEDFLTKPLSKRIEQFFIIQ